MFSQSELSFLYDPAPMLLKRDIFKKLDVLFGEIQLSVKSVLQEFDTLFPEGTDDERGKISKGENYLGLPWMMLDFPAFFTKTSTFSIRSFCWWGNHFSCFVLIGGEALELYRQRLLSDLNPGHGISFIAGDDPWKHNVQRHELQKSDPSEITRQIDDHGFIKLYGSWPLTEANVLSDHITKFVQEAGLFAGFLIRKPLGGKEHR